MKPQLIPGIVLVALFACTGSVKSSSSEKRVYSTHLSFQDSSQSDSESDTLFLNKIDSLFPKQYEFKKDTLTFTLGSAVDANDSIRLIVNNSVLFHDKFSENKLDEVKLRRDSKQLFEILINDNKLIEFQIPLYYDNVKVINVYGTLFISFCVGEC